MKIEVFRYSDEYPTLVTLHTKYKGEVFESRPTSRIFNQEDFDKTIPDLKKLFADDVKRKSKKSPS